MKILTFLLSLYWLISPILLSQQNDNQKLTGPYLGQKPPGDIPQPFLPDIIQNVHSSLTFSPDGKQVYWKEMGRKQLLFMEEVNGFWTPPRPVPFCSRFYRQDVPFFSPDGRRLYFISTKPQHWYQLWSDEGIWYVEKKGSGWSRPKLAGDEVNKLYTHWQFSVSAKGNIFLAGSVDEKHDIWYIYKSEIINGRYTKPEKLGESINAIDKPIAYCQVSPFIAPDESFLIFSRQEDVGSFGRGDLYISYRKMDSSWTKAINMGSKINSKAMEICPIGSPDGKYLFFMRHHSIMWVDTKIIEELRPKE
jgi:hypothetical protein